MKKLAVGLLVMLLSYSLGEVYACCSSPPPPPQPPKEVKPSEPSKVDDILTGQFQGTVSGSAVGVDSKSFGGRPTSEIITEYGVYTIFIIEGSSYYQIESKDGILFIGKY